MNYIEEEKEKIIQELLNSNKIFSGQLIDYKYFLSLYEPYKESMSEIDFAQILGLTYEEYKTIKRNKGKKIIVLKKEQEEISEEEKEKILQEVLSVNKLIPEQLINYEYFLLLYEPYNNKIKETVFAKILGIDCNRYLKIRNYGTKTRILKQKEISKEEKEEIIQELLSSNKLKKEQLIDYKYFLDLYEPYKVRMKEIEFAKILGINFTNFMNIKCRPAKTRVLKIKREKINEDEKKRILQELLSINGLIPGQLINYKYFLSLYETYKDEMKEIEFAEALGLNYSDYTNMKNNGKKRKILKIDRKQISEEEKEEIIKGLLISKKVKVGQLINYDYFLELYEPYKERLKEREFAQILGIKHNNFMTMKKKKTRARVNNYRNKEKIDRIRDILNKNARYYSKEEIENISKEYEIDVDTIIEQILCAGKKQHLYKYNQKLQEEGQVWIGYTECSKSFAETHAETIIEQARKRSEMVCSRYRCNYLEKDFASDAIVFVLQMCGDIDKNFSNKKDVAEEMIIGRVYAYIRNKCLTNFTEVKKFLDEVRYISSKGEKKIFERQISDEVDVEEEVIERLVREKPEENFEETCIRLLKKNIELGYDRSETVTRTAEALDINPEEMIQMLQKYMLEQKRARETESGGIVIGE